MEAQALPVSVVISRTPVPGREDELVDWAEGICAAADEFPGHLGGRIYPPGEVESGDLVLVFSFRDAQALGAWEHSKPRSEWIARAEGLVLGEARTHAVSGFEGILARTSGVPVVPPPRWKTAAIIALALYPMSLLLNIVLVPHIDTWNVWLRVLVTTAVIVPYMAWVGVPYLSRWLRPWLQTGMRKAPGPKSV